MNDITHPPLPNALYKPGIHTIWSNVLFETSLGCNHVILVQPSFYGADNTFMLNALVGYGPERARAVVVFDAENITTQQLQEWDDIGVRGVRLNFASTERILTKEELRGMLVRYAELVRPWDWVVQLYINMEQIPSIEDVVMGLGVRVVFDHMGAPQLPESLTGDLINPYGITGFGSLVRLLQQGNSYVKISAPYRFSRTGGPLYRDLETLIKELVRVAPRRVVYASDWPHTRFDGLDIVPWTRNLRELVGGLGEGVVEGLFRDNAEGLWRSR
ncbi:related to TIM barrel metal-dependent hydrolase [Ramularia collo-cygni]|uniref:Related to TIM barrel metal-dependent hydrolase n=1 Tax=Ramularia collo-cygni TaxID=112498 RepID=A0A2D3VNC3_9PEZI|nr:related to TIM barrel metal-dependent hydrolase [Ramularia collo-cygni]CZT25469.1 related to TIM barrel metal-dependent hydrolase [Ramularia collo-cygni]